MSNEELVRRHSLSLRDLPSGSVAEEILDGLPKPPVNHYALARTILSDLKEMSERCARFSDFESCREEVESSMDGNSSSDDGSFQIQGRRPKRKKSKSNTPEREFFLKKQNTSSSPRQ